MVLDFVPGGKAMKAFKGAAAKLGIKKVEKQLLKEARKAARQVGKGRKAVKAGSKSINQLNKLVQTGKAPRGIKRFDKGLSTKNLPYDEVHFTNGSSLYRNGIWRHDKGHILTNDQIKFLEANGWEIPK